MNPAKKRRRAEPKSGSARSKHVPLVRAALALSLDGFIAETDGGVAWLNPFFSPEMDFAGFMKTMGVFVTGRKTFGDALKLGGSPGSGERTVVLTHRPLRNTPRGVEAFSGDLRKLVSRLRRELSASGKDIWLMGGGLAIDSFRAAGLIDRFELSVIPVLLGDGIPLFPRQSRGLEGLTLTHTRALKNGVVELWYECQRARRGAPRKPAGRR